MKVRVKQTADPAHSLKISACRAAQITVVIAHESCSTPVSRLNGAPTSGRWQQR